MQKGQWPIAACGQPPLWELLVLGLTMLAKAGDLSLVSTFVHIGTDEIFYAGTQWTKLRVLSVHLLSLELSVGVA